MVYDVPNAYVQTPLPSGEGVERIIMKITGELVDMLVEMEPDTYQGHVVLEKGRKVLYVQVNRAIYGMLISAVLWYRKFRADLEEFGFAFNPYDPCVANREVRGSQHTICFHVDDCKSSHKLRTVNEEFLKWSNDVYGKFGEVKATFGKVQEFLGMTLDYREPGIVKIDMKSYIVDMIENSGIKVEGTHSCAAPSDLFTEGCGVKLSSQEAELFHSVVAKGLFVCKRARPDIQPAIAVLCTRVKEPHKSDWRKLIHLLKFLNGSRDDVLTLSADNLHVLKWLIDAAFAVHPDFRSHTGGILTMGRGAIISQSRKQKLNTKSSTEAELVGADDMSTMMLWSALFLEAQGYKVKKNILYQDNKSTIQLLKHGKASSSKRTRHLNIRYFFLTDQIEKGNLIVQYCPTGRMTGDYMSKPVQGKLFQEFRREVMGMQPIVYEAVE
jgi:hypothetical protein